MHRWRSLHLLTLLVVLTSGCAAWRSSDPVRAVLGNPRIYDPSADGEQQLADALVRAKAEEKRVLLSLGANWCSDSQRMFHLLRTDSELQRELSRSYVLAMVDVNDRDGPRRNASLLERFPNALDRGIPTLLVLDGNGKWLNPDVAERLEDSDHEHPDKVLGYLRKWAKDASQ